LLTTDAQAEVLQRTLEMANAACHDLSDRAWQRQTCGQVALHRLAYYDCRARFPELAAPVIIRCEAKVAAAYQRDHETQRTFKRRGAIAYDARLLSWNLSRSEISIWTLAGRQKIQFAAGQRQRRLLAHERGFDSLCLVGETFYLVCACEVAAPEPRAVDDFLGVDVGIVNLAADSDGAVFSGAEVEAKRLMYAQRRRNLQRRGRKSARRKLKKRRGRQARFQQPTNHVIAKPIAHTAQDTGRGVALEALGGIRERVTVGRRQRARRHNWAFAHLSACIVYKCAGLGVPVVLVDPHHPSQQCERCGWVDRRNRPDQATFQCVSCGYAAEADKNAARNIRARAAIDQPMVSTMVRSRQGQLSSYSR
jgi:IS605 OrfB family transposase